jgi:hypothetical protein
VGRGSGSNLGVDAEARAPGGTRRNEFATPDFFEEFVKRNRDFD